MHINWKQLAKSPGYRSLKAEYIKSAMYAGKRKHPMRSKEVLYRNFQWVINRAKHYAEHLNKTVESVLNEWEEKRTYGALNYYQDGIQPRFHTGSKKPMCIKGSHAYYKKEYRGDTGRIKERMKSFIKYQQRCNPEKDKPRWSTARKKRGY